MFTKEMKRIVDHFGKSLLSDEVENKARDFIEKVVKFIELKQLPFSINVVELAKGNVVLDDKSSLIEEKFKDIISELIKIKIDRFDLYHICICYVRYIIEHGLESLKRKLEHERRLENVNDSPEH